MDIRHPSVDVAENLSAPWEAWQLQTETLVDGLWQPVDVGEVREVGILTHVHWGSLLHTASFVFSNLAGTKLFFVSGIGLEC